MVSTTFEPASQIASPATSIRWGATPTPSMYSPRASLEVMRTPGGIPVLMSNRRSISASDIAAEKAAKKDKKEAKEAKSLLAKVKKSVNKNTQDYWTNGMNFHYSGVFARV